MINARSETVPIKPAFSDALKFLRCLIPADGFYEWKKSGKAKQPYCFEVNRPRLQSVDPSRCGQLTDCRRVHEKYKDLELGSEPTLIT
jgi:hypothetical protein